MDCVSGRRYAVSPEIVAALDDLRGADRPAGALLKSMTDAGLVTTRQSSWPWSAWMPEAAFFHFGTRASHFETDVARRDRQLRRQARHSPPPPPTKSTRGKRASLPAPSATGELSDVLKARRTWRNFSRKKIGLADVSALLSLTFGVQHHATVKGQGPVVLKTSPSAGARHPIEAYLLAANVDGQAPGVYHYDCDGHELVAIKRGLSKSALRSLLGDQPYFADAGAVVVMSAVFARSMWKYPSPRAYRSILLDAGHLGQTFCLVATALGLAPFSTMAFRERDLDAVLGIDGVNESAIYIVGVGAPRANEKRPGRLPSKGKR